MKYRAEKNRIVLSIGVLVGLAVLVGAPIAQAALTYDSKLSQAITAGTLSTDVRDSSNVVVVSPSFSMGSVVVSNSQQTATGTFGSASQRISVDNPGGANGGWTLALGATTPATEKWVSGGNNYAFNGASASVGQLTVNPAAGTITPVVGSSTGLVKGSSSTFSGSTPITLIDAGSTSDDIWNGYMTGIGLSQTIPGSQPAGTYTINMTQTVTTK